MYWRPDNWKNLYTVAYEGSKDMHIGFAVQAGTGMQGIAYEAGASAMLEALRVVHSLKGIDAMVEAILKP